MIGQNILTYHYNALKFVIILQQRLYSYILLLKVRGQDACAHGLAYLLHGPELAAVKFVARVHLAVVCCAVYVYQLPLALALKDVSC